MNTVAPRFYKLCVFVLCVEWTVFGSMHFSFPGPTENQIPEYITPDAFRHFIVVATGMAQVTVGILILIPQVRRWAALGSLALLILFIPSVYHILASETAVQGPVVFVVLFKVLLIPNNLFLAICSIHIWQNQQFKDVAPAQLVEETLVKTPRQNFGNATLLVAVLMLLSNLAGFFAIWFSAATNIAAANLWAMMCIASGALIGFLFAVPRVNEEFRANTALLTNTNIEIVSDWLTKILVGLGLIHLKDIGTFVVERANELGRLLGPVDTDGSVKYAAFASAMIVYFFVVGLIQGYLLTRMFLTGQFANQIQNASDGEGEKPTLSP